VFTRHFDFISADNLGAHSVFGFLESFSAKKFCRLCEASKTDKKCFETDYTLRTAASYNAAVACLKSPGYNPSLTGIKAGCILNELSTYHVTTNYALDAMHDLLEGVVPFELQFILPMLVKQNYVSEKELQSLVVNFNYGPADQNSKPPLTCSTNIRVKAAEAWCLLPCLPLILSSRIPADDPYWKLLKILCAVTDIIFAPRYSKGFCPYLAYLIEEHHQKFQLLFPDVNMLPKHHFLLHYPRFMLLSGPPSRYWCMRFEARHNFFKELALISRYFKNICKKLANRAQFSLTSSLMLQKLFSVKQDIGPCIDILVSNLPTAVSSALQNEGLSEMDCVHICKWISVGHYRIQVDNCIVYKVVDEYPVFGTVRAIVYFAERGYFALQVWKTLNYDAHFRLYTVQSTYSFVCCAITIIRDHHPSVTHTITCNAVCNTFVQTRYLIL
jgi:hypothetical protein